MRKSNLQLFYNRILSLCFILPAAVSAQNGGNNAYEFLNIPSSARTASLGGTLITLRDDDIHLVTENPAALTAGVTNKAALSYLNYFSDIYYGNLAYANSFKNKWRYYTGLRYLNYGDFYATDIGGNVLNKFYAAEYSLDLGGSIDFDTLFFAGILVKTIYSQLETYWSIGQALDVGGVYISQNRTFSGAVTVKNFGLQYKPYRGQNREFLPFEIQAGISKKLKHSPFRFNLTLNHLETWNLTYDTPLDDYDSLFIQQDTIGEKTKTGKFLQKTTNTIVKGSDKTLRHLVIGTEILLTENFHLRFGYNYRRRKEMIMDVKKGLSGFSAGFGLRINRFHLSYGLGIFFPGKASHYFSLSTNISDFRRKTAFPGNMDEYR